MSEEDIKAMILENKTMDARIADLEERMGNVVDGALLLTEVIRKHERRLELINSAVLSVTEAQRVTLQVFQALKDVVFSR